MPVKVNLTGLKTLQKQLPRFTKNLIKDIAKKTPENIIRNIIVGKKGLNDRAQLPQNKVSTINRKRAQGKPPDPLIDDRELINKRNWSVKKSGKNYIVKLDDIRSKISFYLHKGIKGKGGKKKYQFMLKPKKYIPDWVKIIKLIHETRFFAKFK